MKDEPAFPVLQQNYWGLTKREWFAGMALQGILSNQTTVTSEFFRTADGWTNPELIADCALKQADAMLKAIKPDAG